VRIFERQSLRPMSYQLFVSVRGRFIYIKHRWMILAVCKYWYYKVFANIITIPTYYWLPLDCLGYRIKIVIPAVYIKQTACTYVPTCVFYEQTAKLQNLNRLTEKKFCFTKKCPDGWPNFNFITFFPGSASPQFSSSIINRMTGYVPFEIKRSITVWVSSDESSEVLRSVIRDGPWPDPTRAYFWPAVNKRPTRLRPGTFRLDLFVGLFISRLQWFVNEALFFVCLYHICVCLFLLILARQTHPT